MTRINNVLKYIYDKKTGMIGFKIGNNITVKAKNRKSFKFALKCALIPPNKDDLSLIRRKK